jgi:hypothetical protein
VSLLISSPEEVFKNWGMDVGKIQRKEYQHLCPDFRKVLPPKISGLSSEIIENKMLFLLKGDEISGHGSIIL